MKALINKDQMTLWHELPVFPESTASRLIFTEHKNDDGDITGHSARLLPTTAGDNKPSLAKSTGLTGEELKNEANKASLSIKEYLVSLANKANASADIGGVGMRITEKRMTLTFKRLAPQVRLLSDEELAAQLGVSVSEVTELRKKGKKQEVELVPAPQNGTPELKPVDKKRGKKS
jgi:hypothetical protein